MEVRIPSPIDGVCVKTHVKEGTVVDAEDTLAVIRLAVAQERASAVHNFAS